MAWFGGVCEDVGMSKEESQLDRWRREIEELDRRLLATVARRSEVVRRVAAAKEEEGDRPLFDRKRERQVYERAESVADSLGLPRSVARQLMETVIEHSHQVQEAISQASSLIETAESSRRFVIVGGGGRMGRLLGEALTARGHEIDVIEADDQRDRGEVLADAEIVIVAVPMHAACEVLREITPLVPANALLCDINSLKEDVCAVMEEHGTCEAIGLHPMFGPSVRSLRRQKLVVCPVRRGPLGEWVQREFGQLGMELIESDPTTHDRMMAIVQVLVHYSTLVMGRSLQQSGIEAGQTLRFTSPIYRLELTFIGRLFAQNPDLYAEIEMTNPHGRAAIERFQRASGEIGSIIAAGDREAFRDVFREVSAYFADFSEDAMTMSDSIIDTIVTQP